MRIVHEKYRLHAYAYLQRPVANGIVAGELAIHHLSILLSLQHEGILMLLNFLLTSTVASSLIRRDNGGKCYRKNGEGYKHVAICPFDGLRASDMDKYLTRRGPSSNLTGILEHSHRFARAYKHILFLVLLVGMV